MESSSTSGTDTTGGDTTNSDTTGDDTGFFTSGDSESMGFESDSSPGCNKVDFLFVVDNHNGGLGALTALNNSLSEFVDNINQKLPDHDIHFMAVDTDNMWGSLECDVQCGQNDTCAPAWPDYACEFEPQMCDEAWGAGIVTPSGQAQKCPVVDGGRYITNETNSLEDDLACILDVGSHGTGQQQQARALTTAIGGTPCNSGFLRDDALLVVTLITHTADDESPNSPDGWYDQIVNKKNGNDEAVVMLGLLDDSNDKPDNICDQPVFDPDDRLGEFVNMFPNSIEGSVCSPSYTPFFDDAFEIITQACQDFVYG